MKSRGTAESLRLFQRALKIFAGGVNHNARYQLPYPISIERAKGSRIWDVDGNEYTDYWIGHMALILGHSPKPVVEALAAQIANGTHFGAANPLSLELGELVCRTVPCAEMLRFCNSGAEATMYLVRLARGFTKKRVVVKISGGWHGYNTELNKAVRAPFDRTEGAGIVPSEQEFTKPAKFNDIEAAERAVRSAKGDVAAIFLEPVLGAGGCIPATRDYLKGLRELCDRTGCLLAFDEVITGFRLALGGAQEAYRVRPDIAALGKVVGGGLPIGVVCGEKEVMSLADPRGKKTAVSIGGGTFSENPLSMTAGIATLKYLMKHEEELYRRLDRMGESIRKGVDRAMVEQGMTARTTGKGSLFFTHFGSAPMNAEEAARGDGALEAAYAQGMMKRGIYVLPGHLSGVSAAHSEREVKAFLTKSGEVARTLKPHRKM